MCLIPTFMVRPLITRRENPPEIGQIQGDGSHVATIIERRVRIEFKYMYMWLMSRQIKKSLSIETEGGFAKLFLRPLFKTKFLLFRCYKKKVKFLNQVPFSIAFDFKVHVFFISYVSTSITKPRPCVVFHFDVIAQFGNISISKRP